MIALVSDDRVAVCARLDLVDAQQSEQLLAAVHALTATQQASAAILVAFGTDRPWCSALLDRSVEELGTLRLPVVEAIFADGSRWWSRSCSDGCCPVQGTPYDITSSPLAAEAVYAGLSVATGREAIAASVAGPDPADWSRLTARCRVIDRPAAPLADRQRRMQRLVRAGLGDPGLDGSGLDASGPAVSGCVLTEDTCLELALLARDVHVRDAAWSMMTADRAEAHIDLWRQVVARCAPELASAPLCLVGVAAWIGGNGTLQMCCVERVQQFEGDYSMADLLAELNRQAAPPSLWGQIAPRLRSEIDASANGDRT